MPPVHISVPSSIASAVFSAVGDTVAINISTPYSIDSPISANTICQYYSKNPLESIRKISKPTPQQRILSLHLNKKSKQL